MGQRIHVKPVPSETNKQELTEPGFLVLYNDDFNTFEHVISSLVEVCEHSAEQAEQCATIAHFKGKCEVKKGSRPFLQPLQIGLIRKNLKALIE